MIKICAFCNKPFELDDSDRDKNKKKYCSFECLDEAALARAREYRRNGRRPPRNVKCVICGAEFLTSSAQKITCSQECKRENHRRTMRANNIARREAALNGKSPAKKKNKIPTLAEFNQKARENGMSYGDYGKHLLVQEMRKERMKDGGC